MMEQFTRETEQHLARPSALELIGTSVDALDAAMDAMLDALKRQTTERPRQDPEKGGQK